MEAGLWLVQQVYVSFSSSKMPRCSQILLAFSSWSQDGCHTPDTSSLDNHLQDRKKDRSLQEKPLAAIVSTSFWPWGDIRSTEPMESFLAHNSSKTFTVAKFSARFLGVSWTHVRLMSLPWCHSFLAKYSNVFLLFWFGQFLLIIFYWLLSIAWVQHFFFFVCCLIHSGSFTILPLSTSVSHFHLQHPFSHHFQFSKLLFHFGFHRNHMSLLTSIFSALSLTASPLIGHDDNNVCKTPSF